ncbi:MBL fold metallo-hydrolase [Tahibacter amnicola]|uniref:MBL fold metallo-hydrolase n=1 Tax=Tahibacter amnicola TaxID=2976241 RepID=A0ABY6BR51_9GAMM|nr:MBL fold metallo-hydrolase [Tahibacter amnicola]UXI70242.1 MBL fold metallo-hydrolase [Tahibacter amnicola]
MASKSPRNRAPSVKGRRTTARKPAREVVSKRAAKKTASMPDRDRANAPGLATVRFYCQGIGDAHLLRFEKSDGSPFWMLIDCGIHTSILNGNRKIDEVVADIEACVGANRRNGKKPRIDVIVGTHEHWDHISGFHTAREAFGKFDVGEVWLGWTEDPEDPQAAAFDRFKGNALTALQGAQARLAGVADDGHMAMMRAGIDGLLGFHFGAKGEKTRAAREALVALGNGNVRYVEPADKPITLPGLPNLRIYVLGPPRDESLIAVRERKSEMYGLGASSRQADALINAFGASSYAAQDLATPFDADIGSDLDRLIQGSAIDTDPAERKASKLLTTSYLAKDEAYRRIDNDWLGVSSDLAIQLDNRTNNSSVVLAFEFIDSGRVMLFAADAQVGNWLSWQNVSWKVDGKTVTAHDLLARTVLYKVGHHGSENATLKQKGLELMVDKDLTAFIPTNKDDAERVRWGAMPFNEILDALHRRAGKRVVRADDAWLLNGKAPFRTPSGSIQRVSVDPDKRGLWVELDIA